MENTLNQHFRKKHAHKIQQTRERRERADAAPPLAQRFPALAALRFEIHETREGAEIPGSRRARPIVVPHATAHFELPCIDPECHDGGHDLTANVLRELGSRRLSFEGSHTCSGSIGSSPCQRHLHWIAQASWTS